MAKKKRFKMTGQRWQLVGLAVLGLVTLGVVAYALIPAPSPTASPASARPAATITPPPVVKPLTVAIIGDSYTPQLGATTGGSYVDGLAARTSWKILTFGQGGTGYTNPGDAPQNETVYLGRVPGVIEAKPDVVIVQGSTNDHAATPVTQAAASEVYAALRAGLPEAKIVAVGPLSPPDAIPAEIEQTRAALIAATQEASVPFIDPTAKNWLQPTEGLFVDGFHPNEAGHRKISELLITDLAALGIH